MSLRSESAAALVRFADEIEEHVELWPRRQVLEKPRAAAEEASAILREAARELTTKPQEVRV